MELGLVLVGAAFWILLLGGVGYWIAQQKARDEVEGIALGCLLGPIGWIIEALLPTGTDRKATVTPRPTRPAAPTPPRRSIPANERPKGWHFATDPRGGTGQEAEARALEQARSIIERETAKGDVLVEAVWRGARLGLAFGDPGVDYPRLWPDGEDIKGRLLVAEPPEVDEADSEPMEEAQSSEATKRCPDCAETVLAAARICRFCRYEFRPAEPATSPDIASPSPTEPSEPPSPTPSSTPPPWQPSHPGQPGGVDRPGQRQPPWAPPPTPPQGGSRG